MAQKFVILDRDGTIIEERHHLSRPEEVVLLPGAGAALRKLSERGLGLVIVTNQSAVGRGLLTLETLARIHSRVRDLLNEHHVSLSGFFFCPHTPDDNCMCRKPRTLLAEEAARELGFLLSDSWVVGDNESDIEMGHRLGSSTILVRTGHGHEIESTMGSCADHLADNMAGAAEVIIAALEKTAAMIAGTQEWK